MARSKSEDKRNAILQAAIAVFAEKGAWSTPTSAVSRAAGVAEGTLFTYFSTKEVLVNELYREIKRDLADVLLSDFPEKAPIRSQFHHIWDRYVRWGVKHPQKLRVMTELRLSDKITAESKAIGSKPFAHLERLAKESVRQKKIRNIPFSFIGAIMGGMAETTMAFVAQNTKSGADFSKSGFDLFWKGITPG